MNYNYKIGAVIESERWIIIQYEDSTDDMVGFAELVKKICNDCNGEIIKAGEMRYKIIGTDPCMIYQYDGLFGMVIEYPDDCTKECAIEFINKYI